MRRLAHVMSYSLKFKINCCRTFCFDRMEEGDELDTITGTENKINNIDISAVSKFKGRLSIGCCIQDNFWNSRNIHIKEANKELNDLMNKYKIQINQNCANEDINLNLITKIYLPCSDKDMWLSTRVNIMVGKISKLIDEEFDKILKNNSISPLDLLTLINRCTIFEIFLNNNEILEKIIRILNFVINDFIEKQQTIKRSQDIKINNIVSAINTFHKIIYYQKNVLASKNDNLLPALNKVEEFINLHVNRAVLDKFNVFDISNVVSNMIMKNLIDLKYFNLFYYYLTEKIDQIQLLDDKILLGYIKYSKTTFNNPHDAVNKAYGETIFKLLKENPQYLKLNFVSKILRARKSIELNDRYKLYFEENFGKVKYELDFESMLSLTKLCHHLVMEFSIYIKHQNHLEKIIIDVLSSNYREFLNFEKSSIPIVIEKEKSIEHLKILIFFFSEIILLDQKIRYQQDTFEIIQKVSDNIFIMILNILIAGFSKIYQTKHAIISKQLVQLLKIPNLNPTIFQLSKNLMSLVMNSYKVSNEQPLTNHLISILAVYIKFKMTLSNKILSYIAKAIEKNKYPHNNPSSLFCLIDIFNIYRYQIDTNLQDVIFQKICDLAPIYFERISLEKQMNIFAQVIEYNNLPLQFKLNLFAHLQNVLFKNWRIYFFARNGIVFRNYLYFYQAIIKAFPDNTISITLKELISDTVKNSNIQFLARSVDLAVKLSILDDELYFMMYCHFKNLITQMTENQKISNIFYFNQIYYSLASYTFFDEEFQILLENEIILSIIGLRKTDITSVLRASLLTEKFNKDFFLSVFYHFEKEALVDLHKLAKQNKNYNYKSMVIMKNVAIVYDYIMRNTDYFKDMSSKFTHDNALEMLDDIFVKSKTFLNKKAELSEFQKHILMIIHSTGMKYEHEKDIDFYRVDFYFPENKLVVEIMGPLHFIQNSKQLNNRQRSKKVYLENLGYKVKIISHKDWNLIEKKIDRNTILLDYLFKDKEMS